MRPAKRGSPATPAATIAGDVSEAQAGAPARAARGGGPRRRRVRLERHGHVDRPGRRGAGVGGALRRRRRAARRIAAEGREHGRGRADAPGRPLPAPARRAADARVPRTRLQARHRTMARPPRGRVPQLGRRLQRSGHLAALDARPAGTARRRDAKRRLVPLRRPLGRRRDRARHARHGEGTLVRTGAGEAGRDAHEQLSRRLLSGGQRSRLRHRRAPGRARHRAGASLRDRHDLRRRPLARPLARLREAAGGRSRRCARSSLRQPRRARRRCTQVACPRLGLGARGTRRTAPAQCLAGAHEQLVRARRRCGRARQRQRRLRWTARREPRSIARAR